jgi:MFS transporter, FHS family, glucose/mannose:H+ symporter
MRQNQPMDVSPQSATPGLEKLPDEALSAGKTLPGFLLSGFLMALPGAILPVWGFYRDPPAFGVAGNYFLTLAGGMLVSHFLARRLLSKRGLWFLLVLACCLAGASLGSLGLVPPLASPSWRLPGFLLLGVGSGLFNLSLFHGMPVRWSKNPAGTVNRGGIWYGLGCLAVTLLAAFTFAALSAITVTLLTAVVPGIFALLYARGILPGPRLAATLAPLPTPDHFPALGATLFSLLLFFQFGNEWSIAGWLPLFLIRRIGFSPGAALRTLALYWLFLLLGRLVVVAAFPRVHHGVLLVASVVAALFGCLLLYFTNNGFGATSGVLLVGAGYASVYPLVAEAIGHRFSYYQPAFFSRVFSFATLGGLLAPASIGYAASKLTVGVVMGVPLVGTCLVLMLIVSIWIEARFAV